jgi:predicted CoA-binding protein
VTAVEEILRAATSVLVVDWPSRDVPDTLARAGYAVFAKGGPGPDDYSVRELHGDDVVVRDAGAAPKHVDLVYSYRPPEELPGIVAMATALGAATVWCQSPDPSGEARRVVEEAGLHYVDDVYIVDAVRRLRS